MANFTVLFCIFCTRCDNAHSVILKRAAKKINAFIPPQNSFIFSVFLLILLHGCDIIKSNRQTHASHETKEGPMGKGIYTYYKERLIEIGGNNKCLYLKGMTRKGAYDLGRLFEGRGDKIAEFIDFLWAGGKYPLSIISPAERESILANLSFEERVNKIRNDEKNNLKDENAAKKKIDRLISEAAAKEIEHEISRIKDLKREVEEFEKETGRYELYVGYPFVFGCIHQGSTKTPVKAPLLLFPVKIDIIDEFNIDISINKAENVRINPALVYAYAQAKRINVDQLELEFDDISRFKSVKAVVKYLADAKIKIDYTDSENVHKYSSFKEPDTRFELSVRYAAVLARLSISNSVYNDYNLLEKKNLTNNAISELLRIGKKQKEKDRKKKKAEKTASAEHSYIVKMLDYAQSEVVKKVDKAGNMVIYGPPGTGKSQTIVNIITDAICKHKRVLVVSQKKAALDVVYNRLGPLGSKAMYVTDEGRQKQAFYSKCLLAHQKSQDHSAECIKELEESYNELEAKIADETEKLDKIYKTLNDKREFGLSLTEMYSSSSNLTKNSSEYATYLKLIEEEDIMSLNFKELSEALFSIQSMDLGTTYYSFMQNKERNPIIDCTLPDLDIRTLSEVKDELETVQKSKKALFAISKYPYYRHILTYYAELKNEAALDKVVRFENLLEYPSQLFRRRTIKRTKEQFVRTLEAINEAANGYQCLKRVLTEDGYISVIDNILRGNTSYIKHVYEALDNYIATRDVDKLLVSLDKNKLAILNFAYTSCKSYSNYQDIINKLLEIRIYHEIIGLEESCQDDLSVIVDYNNITAKIQKLKEQELTVAYQLCAARSGLAYSELYSSAQDNKDYLYQISKKSKFWPIRKTMEVYSKFLLSLFPCWLLSPENVSNLLPLEKNMFDIVIFDEASQVFIESTLPTIYRGQSIVVAGDDKQLRPSTTFMKRYMGADPESIDDYSVQAALEVDSLLDLAVSRYESANLTYHYRSRYQELIDFSNNAFYGGGLQISPNISKNRDHRPIERHKVGGKWVDRRNTEEAEEIVKVLKSIFATRKNNESIGIITFNSDQQSHIQDMIDKAVAADPKFRSDILKETHRVENGEDTSLFIKNLENVQGDERDIIIFSIGYAPNEDGKLYTNFGSLSQEGGENRLNVAVTRAKSKIIIVTSIEPEDLKVDNSKNLGPKLLQKYLMYTRAVANGDDEEIAAILSELHPTEEEATTIFTTVAAIEVQMKERLEKLGYKVSCGLGNDNNRISLAIYDEDTDRYLVGVELDTDAFKESASSLERDVYKPKFLADRGWSVVRVWSRDWWLYPSKVIKGITAIAEKNKKS